MGCYEELIKLKMFGDRLNYLKTFSKVGEQTFGGNRYLNQNFYKSKTWENKRNKIIARDCGKDLGLIDISGRVIVHHIDPITDDDILNGHPKVLDDSNLITVSHNTHELIHYSKKEEVMIERTPNDHILW